MKVWYPELPGLIVFEPEVFRDDRGAFLEVFHLDKYNEYLPSGTVFVQDNTSYSQKGTIRGLHFQIEPHAQAKLVRCVYGKILDVAVDLRANSEGFGRHYAIGLSDENQRQIFVPRGFAHGFAVLSEQAIVSYKCDAYYMPSADSGIRYNDPDLGIDWNLPEEQVIISAKDSTLQLFKNMGRNNI